MASRLLYCNLTKGTLNAVGTGGAGSGLFSGLKLGDTIKLSLRMQKEVNAKLVDSDESIQGIKVTLGRKDARPTGGWFSLKFTGGGGFVTPQLAKNASAEEIQNALNGLALADDSDETPNWEVSYVGGSYVIRIPLGEAYPLEVVENKLTPLSFVTQKAWESDGWQYYSIRLTQAPCSVTTDYALVVPALPYITRILGGQYPDELNEGTDEVQSLKIPSEFRGNFQVKRSLTGSGVLGVNADSGVIKEAMDAMSKGIGGTYTITTPTSTADKTFNIQFGGKLAKSPQPLLTINVIDAPNGDLTFALPLNSVSLLQAVEEGGGTTNLFLEGEATITEGASTRALTLFSTPVSVTAKLSEPITTALAGVNWAVPPEPANYIPYSPTQVLFGAQHYETIIGGALSKIYVITHNLNPAGNTTIYGIHLTLRTNVAGGRRLRDDEYVLTFGDNNTLSITTTADWLANSLIATISTAGPRSAFQQHQHTIAEITGLGTLLGGIEAQLGEIISVMPAISNMLSAQTQIPAQIDTPLNATFCVLGVSKYRDGKVLPSYASAEDDYLMGAEKWNTGEGSKLPLRAPILFSAVHDASVTDVTSVPSKGAVNGVYRNVSTKSLKTANGELVAPNEFIGSNGSAVYKVFKSEGGEPSYYPTAYEKTLWQMVSSDGLLSVGRLFQASFGVGTSTYLSNVACKFKVVIEHGAFIEEQANTYGANLERLSYTNEVLSYTIITSPQPQQYAFGVAIKRALVADTSVDPITYTETFTQNKNICGNWSASNATKPTDANFAIRAKITMVDIENVVAPQGFIGINLLGDGSIDVTATKRFQSGASALAMATFATIP